MSSDDTITVELAVPTHQFKKAVAEELAGLRVAVDDLDDQVDSHTVQIETAVEDLNVLTDDVESLSESVATLDARVTTVADNIGTLDTRVTDLEETSGGEVDREQLEPIVEAILRDLLGDGGGDGDGGGGDDEPVTDGGYGMGGYGLVSYGGI